MARLIDADALLEEIREYIDEYSLLDENGYHNGKWCAMKEAEDMLESAPTVDAVEVVRCRDCCYKDKANVNNKGFLICPASGMEITDDDYCSYGKHKGGDE